MPGTRRPPTSSAPRPTRRWSAGAEPAAAAPAAAELEHADTDGEPAPAAEAPAPPLPVADEGVELFGDVEPSGSLAGPDLAEFDVSELDLRPADLPTAVREEPLATLLEEAEGDDGTQVVDLVAAQPLPDDAAAAPDLADAPRRSSTTRRSTPG